MDEYDDDSNEEAIWLIAVFIYADCNEVWHHTVFDRSV
jgi:hypothetical protein